MHSTASDGAHAPSHVIEMADARGLSVVALTDHDTVAGLAEAADAASRSGITFINGIEIDVTHRGGSMHILGYGFNRDHGALLTLINRARQRRIDRNWAIVERLFELGIDIRDDLQTDPDSGQRSDRVPGRPDIAKALVRRGVVRDYRTAFRDFLGDGAKAWVPVELPTARKAIDAIRKAGGVAVLAHPITLNSASDLELETVVAGLAHAGLSGIEVHHPAQDDGWKKRIERHAKRFDLVATGGSDFHAIRQHEPRAAGFGIRIDARIVDELLARATNRDKI